MFNIKKVTRFQLDGYGDWYTEKELKDLADDGIEAEIESLVEALSLTDIQLLGLRDWLNRYSIRFSEALLLKQEVSKVLEEC